MLQRISNIYFAIMVFTMIQLQSICIAANPKNVILMICDGCGFNQIKASDFYEFGREGQQIYENFPVQYAMSTYPASCDGYNPKQAWSDFEYVKKYWTDSAAAGTAMATGKKTYNRYIGMDTLNQPLLNIVEYCESLGKATGVVTSVSFNDATPAVFASHCVNRARKDTITTQMILQSGLEVLMGAGHPEYDTKGKPISPERRSYKDVGGLELWKKIQNGQAGNDCDRDSIIDYWTFIDSRDSFISLINFDSDVPKRVFGLARVQGALQQKRAGKQDVEPFQVPFITSVPTLSEMSEGALHILSNDPDGFFLMIEGGAVDKACHDQQKGQMIEEMVDFNHAVSQVAQWIESRSNWDETLLIVTADHETGYLWGPESKHCCLLTRIFKKQNPWRPLKNNGPKTMPGMQFNSGDHTNSLIAFYAKGMGSDIFGEYADKTDPVRGLYLDNAELGQALFRLMD